MEIVRVRNILWMDEEGAQQTDRLLLIVGEKK